MAAHALSAPPASAEPVRAGAAAPTTIHRVCTTCGEEEQGGHEHGGGPEGEIQRRGEGAPAVTPGIAAAVGAIGNGGEPLPGRERRFFEERFGHELSSVRVHADRPAAEAARSLSAEAFTLGRDVAFAEGRYHPDSDSGRRLLAHELAHVIQQGAAAPLAKGGAAPVAASTGGPQIARQVDEGLSPPPTLASALAPATRGRPADESAQAMSGASALPAAGGGMIVEDDTQTLTSGQMRKSDFLTALKAEACAAADRELERAGRDTKGCPHVVRLLSHYARKPAAHLERAIRKFVPGASATMTAGEYIPLVAARMALGVRTWVETGRIPSDIPDEVRADMMADGGVGAAIAGAIGGAVSSVVGAVGSALSAIGGLFFKEAAPGSARPAADSTALSARLGSGRPLEGATRTRMETAFGQSFGGVRLHDDAGAAGLARDLGAHAFTLGEHVAFGGGNYRPGTPVGDALLAHELAHVVQQGGASSAAGAATPDDAVEHDADLAAVGAVTSLYAPGRGGSQPRPRLRSGLRLSRCGAAKPAGGAKTAADLAQDSSGAGQGGTTATAPGPTGPLFPTGETFGDVKTYETASTKLSVGEATKLSGRSYWEQELRKSLIDSLDPETTARFSASSEERDAVYASVLETYRPIRPLKGTVEKVVSIPARGAGTKALTYSLTFSPSTEKKGLPTVKITFVAEGPGAVAATAGAAPTGFQVGRRPGSYLNFDKNEYFKRYPAEEAQLFNFIDNNPPGGGTQIISTSSTAGKKPHASTFAVSGKTVQGKVQDLTISLLEESAPTTVTLPEGFAKRDYGDFLLEEPGKDGAKLRAIRLPTGLPSDEVFFAKYAASSYFQSGTRNAEVDAIVPMPGNKRVLYTFKFHAASSDKSVDVDVIRVGDAGRAGSVDPAKIAFDLSRSPDFTKNSNSPASLLAWLKKRYPGLSVQGSDSDAIKAAAEKQIAEGVLSGDWLARNYSIQELSSTAADQRMATAHQWSAARRVGFKDFTAAERKLVELSLESMSDTILALLKGTKLVRQAQHIKSNGQADEDAGLAERLGAERTILLFDNMHSNERDLFTGGPGRVAPLSTLIPTHELGHLIGAQAGVEEAFAKKFMNAKSKLATAPITAYAREKGTGTEFFAEAFALYHADPRWMKENLPAMFEWFGALETTGKPPP